MDIVISGASIAGLSTAYWLARTGHAVTVVEIAPSARRGGVAVDVRGEALEVAKAMGIHEEVLASRVPVADIYRFLDADGRVQATFEPAVDFYDSPEDIEISRDRLSDILEAAVPDGVQMLNGLSIAALEDDGDSVTVTLSDGTSRRADLVVGADGMHSNVRALAFGPESDFVHHLGLYVAIVKRCRAGHGLEGSHVYNSPGRMLMLRGDGRDCSALLGFRSPPIDYDFRDPAAQRVIVREAFRGDNAWKLPEVVEEVGTAEDFYFDAAAQIRMSSWHRGRVVLVGDAAFCASFFSGMGTSLAMLGGHRLAEALSGEDIVAGLERYEASMRPVVDRAQAMADEGAAILFPATDEAIEARNRDMMATAG
jgi:2-polyprenyl-6-methoxyphenol hydroxylase-like FAD-dependent oxidoreductase